jgi:hypothetical protein
MGRGSNKSATIERACLMESVANPNLLHGTGSAGAEPMDGRDLLSAKPSLVI